MKVDFMIIGAQKSGTTTLAFQLAQHPSISFSKNKEPGYFNRPDASRGSLAEYHALYSPSAGQLCGEASTMYTFLPEWSDTHVRLHEYNPELKFIYIMRNPIERIISHYAHRLLHERATEPPDLAVLGDPTYINRSRYAVQTQPYIELFGRDKVLLLVFEDYVRDPIPTLRETATFLGIDPAPFLAIDIAPRHVTADQKRLQTWASNARRSTVGRVLGSLLPAQARKLMRETFTTSVDQKPEISKTTRRTLWRFLRSDVEQVERLLGRRLEDWSPDIEGRQRAKLGCNEPHE